MCNCDIKPGVVGQASLLKFKLCLKKVLHSETSHLFHSKYLTKHIIYFDENSRKNSIYQCFFLGLAIACLVFAFLLLILQIECKKPCINVYIHKKVEV